MKNFLFAVVAGCIPALAFTNETNAQQSVNFTKLELPTDVTKLDDVTTSGKNNTVDMSAISAKALKVFKRSYKTVNDEKWYTTSEGGFTASFTSNGISNTIYYNKNGQWKASLKNYQEDKLDRNIKDIVKRAYYDYKITLVQEIETTLTDGIPTYLVHMQDEKNIKIIRVSDGEMDVYQEYKK